MNRNQALTLAIAAANIIFIMLFPPFDIYSISAGSMPVFGGFDFYFNRNPYMIVNSSVLVLELMVVLINAGIACLLFNDDRGVVPRRRLSMQSATLLVVSVNLIVILLFPPFESVFAMTKATLPTFEGFYFIFSRHPNHVIVAPILYLEVFFLLINGALFWLFFRRRSQQAVTQKQAYQLAQEIRGLRG